MIAQSLDGRRLAGPTGGEPDEGPPGSKRFDGRQCRGDDQIVPVDGVGDGRTHPTAFRLLGEQGHRHIRVVHGAGVVADGEEGETCGVAGPGASAEAVELE